MAYTAAQLHDLTAALFSKHPSAKPEWIHCDTQYIGCEVWRIEEEFHTQAISAKAAEPILTGHIAKWLAEKEDGILIEESNDVCTGSKNGWSVLDKNGDSYLGSGPTLLAALVAAAEAVP